MNSTAEQRLKQLLDEALMSSTLAWWEWDIPGNLVIANDLKTTMLGYRPEEFQGVGYQAYTNLIHPDDYDRTMQAMRDHLDGSAPLYQIDYRIRRADGEYTWYMDRGCIIEWDRDKRPIKLRGVVADLGETLREKSHDEAVFRMIRSNLPVAEDTKQVVVLCSWCKRIKFTEDIWTSLDSSFEKVFFSEISHGICKDCTNTLYPDVDNHCD